MTFRAFCCHGFQHGQSFAIIEFRLFDLPPACNYYASRCLRLSVQFLTSLKKIAGIVCSAVLLQRIDAPQDLRLALTDI